MKQIVFAVAVAILLTSCGELTVKVWDKPIVGVKTDGEKDKDGKSVPAFGTAIVVHNYNYGAAAQPSPALPGTPPAPPQSQSPGAAVMAPAVAYATVYKTMEDPTKRAFVNQSMNFVRLQIDGNPEEVRLAPHQSSVDISFSPGEHRIRVIVERPTENFGILETTRFMIVSVRPEDRWQPIYVNW